MEHLSVAKIIRVKNYHFVTIESTARLETIIELLKKSHFELHEASDDGFIETYESKEFTDKNKNTFLFFDATGHIMDVKATVIK